VPGHRDVDGEGQIGERGADEGGEEDLADGVPVGPRHGHGDAEADEEHLGRLHRDRGDRPHVGHDLASAQGGEHDADDARRQRRVVEPPAHAEQQQRRNGERDRAHHEEPEEHVGRGAGTGLPATA
jgi:hypothetical protein